MPVCSYLVQPRPGQKQTVLEKLANIKGCEVIPAQNREVMILVTDTVEKSDEQLVQAALKSIQEIESVTMTFGQIDPSSKEEPEHEQH